MIPDRDDCGVKILRATMEAARRFHPQLGLSFGYIGNVEFVHPRRDDRCWSVFYLALAERLQIEIVTADVRMVNKFVSTGFAHLLQPLVYSH